MVFLGTLVFFSCSRTKDKAVNRYYHKLTSRYNPLYNGNKAYENAILSLKEEHVDDFDQINFEEGNKFFLDISNGKNHSYKLSECSKESGESVLSALNLALELAKENKIHAINFGPFNKTSLKLGGNRYSDELHLMAEKLEVKNFFCEFNVM